MNIKPRLWVRLSLPGWISGLGFVAVMICLFGYPDLTFGIFGPACPPQKAVSRPRACAFQPAHPSFRTFFAFIYCRMRPTFFVRECGE